jgi:hypothetical protein
MGIAFGAAVQLLLIKATKYNFAAAGPYPLYMADGKNEFISNVSWPVINWPVTRHKFPLLSVAQTCAREGQAQ